MIPSHFGARDGANPILASEYRTSVGAEIANVCSRRQVPEHAILNRPAPRIALNGKPIRAASFQSRCLFFPILSRRIGLKGAQKLSRNARDGIDRRLKCFFVGLRRLVETR